jgi:hypothetical protein
MMLSLSLTLCVPRRHGTHDVRAHSREGLKALHLSRCERKLPFTANVCSSHTPRAPGPTRKSAQRAPAARSHALLRARSVARRAQRVRRCDPCTRTPHRPRTRNSSSPLRCFPPWCPAGIPGAHMRLPLSHGCDFSACLSAVARRRRPVCLPPLHPRALHCHATARRACDSPFALSFGPHMAAIPLILPACCVLLHACVETLQATFKLAAARGPTYLHAAEYPRLLFAG